MDVLTFIVEIIGVLAWPLVVGLIILNYKSVISDSFIQLTKKLSKMKAGPLSADFIQNVQPATTGTLLADDTATTYKIKDPTLHSIVLNRTKTLPFLKDETNIEQVKYLCADFQIATDIERVYSQITGSQMRALYYAHSKSGSVSDSEIERFYSEAKSADPDIFANFSFLQWRDFLLNTMLMAPHNKPSEYVLTDLGIAFAIHTQNSKYLIKMY